METRWYLSPGQTLENTKIDERGHALHITPNEWNKISHHLDRKRLIQEAIEKEKAFKEARVIESKQMTDNWPNSLQNARATRQAAYLARLQKIKDDRMENFYKLREEQAERKRLFIEDARRKMYISTGPPKTLTSAFVLSEVLYEREKQLEFANVLEEHNRKVVEKEVEKIKRGVQEEKEEKEECARKFCKTQKKYQETLVQMMNDRAEAERNAKADKIANEVEDNLKSVKESEEIQRIEMNQIREIRADAKKEFNDFRELQKKLKAQKEQENKEIDNVIDIYQKAKHNIGCLRRKKEKEMIAATLKRREEISSKIAATMGKKASDEDRILKIAQAERDEIERLRLEADEAHLKQMNKEKREDYDNFMLANARKKKVMEEQKKWEMLNRFKATEVMSQYDEDKIIEACEKKKIIKQETFGQIDEDQDKQKNKDDLAELIYRQEQEKFFNSDKKYFEYADEVRNHAASKGWNTYPIERAVKDYKKENGLPLDCGKICRKADY